MAHNVTFPSHAVVRFLLFLTRNCAGVNFTTFWLMEICLIGTCGIVLSNLNSIIQSYLLFISISIHTLHTTAANGIIQKIISFSTLPWFIPLHLRPLWVYVRTIRRETILQSHYNIVINKTRSAPSFFLLILSRDFHPNVNVAPH